MGGWSQALWIGDIKLLLLPLGGEASSSYKDSPKGQSYLAGEEEDL